MQNIYPEYQGYPGYQGFQGYPGDQVNPLYEGVQGIQENPVLPIQENPVFPIQESPAFPIQAYPDFQEFKDFKDVKGFQGHQANCPAFAESQSCDFFPAGVGDIGIAGRFCNEVLTRIIQECEATCEYATTHLKRKSDCRGRRNQLILLRDCADICGDTAKFVARGSAFDREKALLCARICECCGQECSRFCDKISRLCAEICFYCAKACLAFAQGF